MVKADNGTYYVNSKSANVFNPQNILAFYNLYNLLKL